MKDDNGVPLQPPRNANAGQNSTAMDQGKQALPIHRLLCSTGTESWSVCFKITPLEVSPKQPGNHGDYRNDSRDPWFSSVISF
jgi:hypothetical protein